jgi:tetratricopeptide (TPR) repeat protein
VDLSLALINMERKRFAKAREYLDKCWAIVSQGFGFTSRMASVRSYMGELSIRVGALDEAETCANEAIQLAQQAEVPQELAHATMVKAVVEIQRRNWDRALEHCHDAQRVFEDLQHKYNCGRIYAVLGQLYLERDQDSQDRTRSQENLARALAIFRELGARPQLDNLSTT